MTALVDACQALTEPWAEILLPDEDRPKSLVIEHEPRLVMLADRIGSGGGGTTGGATLPSNRNLIDPGAFNLWQRIDKGTREALHLAGHVPHRDLIAAVRQLGVVHEALWSSHGMTETAYLRLVGRVEKWRADFENLIDPPRRREVTGACPNCGEARVETTDGEAHALISAYWPARGVTTECQVCGETWQGPAALVALGEAMGMDIDYAEVRMIGVGA